MLIATFHNVAQRGQQADYDVKVYVNHTEIASLHLKDHDRRKGWQALVRKLGREASMYETPKGLRPKKPQW